MKPFAALLLVALAGYSAAVPTGNRYTCADHCDGTNNFAYESGKSYIYAYTVATSTALLGTFDDDTQMHITATAHIDVSAPCEYILRLTDVNLVGSSQGPAFAAEVTRSPLRFSFQDGRVESLCGETSEPSWVLNFKRGVLSTFQNNMGQYQREDIEETDISGVCLTHYNRTTEGDVVTVDKTKDLASCSQRSDLRAFLPSTVYSSDSPVQGLPLFRSTSRCQQKIEEGLLRNVECQETHVFRPFSSDEGGAVTTAKTTMTLVSQERYSSVPDFEFKRTTLPFEHTTTTNVEDQIEETESILRELEEVSQRDIRPEVPSLFARLVASLRVLNYTQLNTIYTNVKGTRTQKFLVDAMPLVETSAAFSVVKDMFENEDLTESEADVFFTSLAFVKNPSGDMFTAIAPLFEERLSQQAMLGTSALINTYCKINEDCAEDASVQRVIRRIETELGSGCRSVTEAERVYILVALKALGNTGRFVNADSILRRCYSENNAMEVRVAAIEAFRHTPCEHDRSHLLTTFRDESQDTEIRIAAYLALMTCPTPDFIAIVKDRLTSEGVNQVGSFIWTHMTNMQESAAPEKQWVRELIGEDLLQKKFSTEALKFSRNYESSFFTNELNVGASVESNVIFSSKSYLPRSAMFNLTLDLFGQSVNFFEVGGRIEGFEAYIERFFGPRGYYPEETIENILRTMRRNNEQDATTLEGFLDEITDEPEGSYYLRIFGNELHYNHFRGLENLIQASNPLQFLMELARKGEIDYSKSYQLMDAHHTVPTITGLPVTLNAKGTATLGLKMNGNFKARSLKNVNIEGYIHPSAAVLFDGVMLVDAHVTRTGLKMASTLHTSTSLDGKLQISGGKLVDVAFNTPRDKMEVISVKNEFFYLQDGQEIPKKGNPIHVSRCTDGISGVAICNDVSFTQRRRNGPSFPLSGPFASEIYLKTTDTQTGYFFHFLKEADRIQVEFDTPGSQTDRRVVLDINRSGKRISFDIRSPFKKAVGSGEYNWQRNNKNIRASIDIDGSGEYSFDMGLHTTRSGLMQFEPHMVVASPSGEIFNLQGSFTGKSNPREIFVSSKIDVEYSFFQSSKQSISHSALVKRQIENESQTYTLRFKVVPSAYPKMAIEVDASSTVGRHGYMDVTGNIAARVADYTTSFTGIMKPNDNSQYYVQIKGNINEETGVFEATLENNSVPGKINKKLVSSLKIPGHNVAFYFDLFGDRNEASVDLRTDVNGENYSLKLQGKDYSFLVDANIVKHIVVNAKVTPSTEAQQLLVTVEWDKDVDPTKSFVIDGLYSPDEIHAIIRYGEREVSAIGKLIGNGIEIETKWAEDQRISANVQYRLGSTNALSTTIETPFYGWEKQDASVSFSIRDHEVDGHFVATWRNTQQMTFRISGRLEPGLNNNALVTKVSFTSPFDSYERLTFSLDHKTDNFIITTNLEGIWNQRKMEGHFQLTPNANGINAKATFTSPFTEDVLATFHHELLDQDLATVLELRYGQEISTASLKGHFELGYTHDVTLAFTANSPVPSVPEISANFKYTQNGESLSFITEGKFGAKKVMLNANGQFSVNRDTADISGDLRFITPFTYPLTATLKHTHDRQYFTSQFEMTRIWSTYGSIKAHAEGRMTSQNDVELIFDVNSPDTKASASVTHKFSETNTLRSTARVAVNGELIAIVANGRLDTEQRVIDLDAEMTSTFNDLQDMKVHLETQRNGNTQTTKVKLSKDINSFTVDHQISFNDWLNWESAFDVNGIYKLVNKQTNSGLTYTHNVDYVWENESLHFGGTFTKKITDDSRKIDVHGSLSTPWTEDMTLEVHHQDDGTEYKPTLIFEYYPNTKIELEMAMRFESTSNHIESSLKTSNWQPLGFSVDLAFEPTMTANLVFTKGQSETNVNVTGTLEEGKLNGQIVANANYITHPISIEISYDFVSIEKIFHLIINTSERYEVKGTFSGHQRKAKWYLTTELPIECVNHFTFSGEYDVESVPLRAGVATILNSHTYQVDGTINSNEFHFNVNLDGNPGNVSCNWECDQDYTNIQVKFQSPFSIFDDIAFSGTYDFRSEKKVIIDISYGKQEINLSARLEDQTVFIEISTPFSEWEKLEASFFLSKSDVKAIVSRNEHKIEVTGTLHLMKSKGNIDLTINTPYTGYETISVDSHYNFQGRVKTVEFKSTFNSNELSFKSEIKAENLHACEMTLNIITPIETIKTIGGVIRWNFSDFIKTSEVKFFHNDDLFLWEMSAAVESQQKGYTQCKVTTPITNWTTVHVKGTFDFTTMPYKIVFEYDKEGVVKTFEGEVTFDHHTILAEIITPVTNWEKLHLSGDFGLENKHFNGSFEFTKGTAKYNMITDIMFSAQNPKIHIEVKTPNDYVTNVEFGIEANFRDNGGKFHCLFKRNNTTYSVDLIHEQRYKTGYVKITGSSPITGYTSVDIYAKYDFTDDIKTTEGDFNVEGNNKHFSINVQVNDNHIIASVTTPFEGFETVRITGDYVHNDNKYSGFAILENESEKYEFQAEIDPEKKRVFLKLATPIPEIENVIFSGKYEPLDHGVEYSIVFQRNSQNFAFDTRLDLTPLKSSLNVSLDTPLEGFRNLSLSMNYDILSEKKSVDVFVTSESFSKKLHIEGYINFRKGYIQIETPIEGFETLEAIYSLDHNDRENTVTANFTFNQSSNQWNVNAYGHYDRDTISLKLETPFETVSIIALEGGIDFDQKTGKALVQIGSQKMYSTFAYSSDNASFELTTPFDIIKSLSLSAKYVWTSNMKNIALTVTYNDHTYNLNSSFQFSKRASEISFQATTPFIKFRNLSATFRYDIDNKEELVLVCVTGGECEYKFKIGGYIEDKIAFLTYELKSHFHEWDDTFVAKIDLTNEDKVLEVTLVRNGEVNAITVHGKLIGNVLDFGLSTPIHGLENLRLFGAVNRDKRSLDFMYMQDEAEVSLVTSFNSMQLHLKTPFENFEEITWEMSKVNDHTLKLEWKRNVNYVTILLKREENGDACKIDLDAFFGDDITISGNATFDVKGIATLHIKTPIEDYKTVDINLDYKLEQKSGRLEMSSTSSIFHILINVDSTIEGHFKVPHEDEDINVTFNFGTDKGNTDIDSPYTSPIHFEYNLSTEEELNYKHTLKTEFITQTVNFSLNIPARTTHLDIIGESDVSYSSLNIDWDSYNKLEIAINQKSTIEPQRENHFLFKIVGSGDLPSKGTVDITLENAMVEPITTFTAHIVLDHLDARQKIKVEVHPETSKVFVFNVDYLADLQSPGHGDFNIDVVVPEEIDEPWQHLSGNWDFENQDDIKATLEYNDITYSATGKLTLKESNIIFKSSDSTENMFLQWHFETIDSKGDYFVKLGKESDYLLAKLKGSFIGIDHVDFEGAFRASENMDDDFEFKAKWQEDGNKFTSKGSFKYGDQSGEYNIDEVHYDSSTKSGSFNGKFTSNIDGLEVISVSGNCDFDGKFVIYGDIKIDDEESKIDINIAKVYAQKSHNTIEFNLPFLDPDIAHTQLTFSHDFSEEFSKSLTAILKFRQSESSLKVNWNLSESHDVFEGGIDAKSIFLGEIHISANFNVSNAENMHADVNYSRNLEGQEKQFAITWVCKSTSNHFETRVFASLPFTFLSTAGVHVTVDWDEIVHLNSGIEWNEGKITLVCDLTVDSLSVTFTSPFENYEKIEAKVAYSLTDNPKKVTINYKRGENEANLEYTVDIISDDEAKLDFTIQTPFDIVKDIHLSASINGENAHIEIQRNEYTYSLDGDVQFDVDKSSFDMKFTGAEGEIVNLAASYDIKDFLSGEGTEKHKLASFVYESESGSVLINISGYRNDDHLNIDIQGKIPFEEILNIHLKIDTNLDTESHESDFELKLNSFEFSMTNNFDKQDDVHFEVKSKIKSTITPLPELALSLKHKEEEYAVTIGYGADKDITFSIEGKENYAAGFSGKVDIPGLDYNGIEYEIEYGFENDDEVHLNIELELGEDEEEVEAKFTYNSEGIKARFNSLYSGENSIRVRRSIFPEDFRAEASFNEYSQDHHRDLTNINNGRGIVVEGDIFGRRFMLDSFFQYDEANSEVKLILVTPFYTMEKVGGYFTWSNINNKINGQAEIYTPFYSMPKLAGEISLDLNEKITGHIAVRLSGEELILKPNLVGSSLQEGYRGIVEIHTPFHAYKKVVLSGHFKMSHSTSFEGEAKVTTPSAIHTFSAEYEFVPEKIHLVLNINSTNLAQEVRTEFNIEGFGTNHIRINTAINENSALVDLNISPNIYEGNFLVTVGQELHRLTGKMVLANATINTQVEVDSSLFGGKRALKMKYSVLDFYYRHVSLDVSLTVSQTHAIHMDLNVISGLQATVEIDSPLFPKTTVILEIASNSAEFSISSPSGVHRTRVDWRFSSRVKSLSFELSSPFTDNYSANLSLNGNLSNMNAEAELQVENVRHSLEGKIVMSHAEGTIGLVIDTPYHDVGRAEFETSLNFADDVTILVVFSRVNEINTLDATFNRDDRSLLVVATSPYIPAGRATAEAKLSGDVNKDMQIKMAVMTSEHTISGDLHVKLNSPQDIQAIMNVLTPFEGYKEIIFQTIYTEDQNLRHFLLYTNRPFDYRVELHFGDARDVIKAEIFLQTPFENFENVTAALEIPLNVFAPRISTQVYINGSSYGGDFGLRLKAPYEATFAYRFADITRHRFHLRTDSSFFSFLA